MRRSREIRRLGVGGEPQVMARPPRKVVSVKRQYKLTRRQKNKIKRGQADYNPYPFGLSGLLSSRLPFRFG